MVVHLFLGIRIPTSYLKCKQALGDVNIFGADEIYTVNLRLKLEAHNFYKSNLIPSGGWPNDLLVEFVSPKIREM